MFQGNTVAIENWVTIEKTIKIVLKSPLNDSLHSQFGVNPSYSILQMFDSNTGKTFYANGTFGTNHHLNDYLPGGKLYLSESLSEAIVIIGAWHPYDYAEPKVGNLVSEKLFKERPIFLRKEKKMSLWKKIFFPFDSVEELNKI